jgi:hypothetical protein
MAQWGDLVEICGIEQLERILNKVKSNLEETDEADESRSQDCTKEELGDQSTTPLSNKVRAI